MPARICKNCIHYHLHKNAVVPGTYGEKTTDHHICKRKLFQVVDKVTGEVHHEGEPLDCNVERTPAGDCDTYGYFFESHQQRWAKYAEKARKNGGGIPTPPRPREIY